MLSFLSSVAWRRVSVSKHASQINTSGLLNWEEKGTLYFHNKEMNFQEEKERNTRLVHPQKKKDA